LKGLREPSQSLPERRFHKERTVRLSIGKGEGQGWVSLSIGRKDANSRKTASPRKTPVLKKKAPRASDLPVRATRKKGPIAGPEFSCQKKGPAYESGEAEDVRHEAEGQGGVVKPWGKKEAEKAIAKTARSLKLKSAQNLRAGGGGMGGVGGKNKEREDI